MAHDAQNQAAQALIRQAEEHVSGALDVILSIMNDPQASNGDRMKAANLILERACGKTGSAGSHSAGSAGSHIGSAGSRMDGAGSQTGSAAFHAGDKRGRIDDLREELEKLRRSEAAVPEPEPARPRSEAAVPGPEPASPQSAPAASRRKRRKAETPA